MEVVLWIHWNQFLLLLWTLQEGRRGRGIDELHFIESSDSIPGAVLYRCVLSSGFLPVPVCKDIAAFRRMYGFANEGCCRTLQPGRREEDQLSSSPLNLASSNPVAVQMLVFPVTICKRLLLRTLLHF